MIKVCLCCKELKEIAHVDPLARPYCDQCVVPGAVAIGSVYRALGLPSTIPFRVGDRVGAFGAGAELYDGVGSVVDVELDMSQHDLAVSYLVVVDQPADLEVPADGWYPGGSLVGVGAR